MHIGYARVSTGEQNLDMQIDALKQADCEKVFTDEMSGARAERPGLQEALAFVRTGDMLVVWRLDRLGRSPKYLVQRVGALTSLTHEETDALIAFRWKVAGGGIMCYTNVS